MEKVQRASDKCSRRARGVEASGDDAGKFKILARRVGAREFTRASDVVRKQVFMGRGSSQGSKNYSYSMLPLKLKKEKVLRTCSQAGWFLCR